MQVTFDRVVCNNGGDGFRTTTSIILLVSNETQKIMGNLVDAFEKALINHGIPVTKPRSKMEPFHTTIAVTRPSYQNVSGVVDLINQQITDWTDGNPIVIDSFEMIFPPHKFWAKDN